METCVIVECPQCIPSRLGSFPIAATSLQTRERQQGRAELLASTHRHPEAVVSVINV